MRRARAALDHEPADAQAGERAVSDAERDGMRARKIAANHARDGYWQLCEETVFAALNDVRTETAERIADLERQLAEARAALERIKALSDEGWLYRLDVPRGRDQFRAISAIAALATQGGEAAPQTQKAPAPAGAEAGENLSQ